MISTITHQKKKFIAVGIESNPSLYTDLALPLYTLYGRHNILCRLISWKELEISAAMMCHIQVLDGRAKEGSANYREAWR